MSRVFISTLALALCISGSSWVSVYAWPEWAEGANDNVEQMSLKKGDSDNALALKKGDTDSVFA